MIGPCRTLATAVIAAAAMLSAVGDANAQRPVRERPAVPPPSPGQPYPAGRREITPYSVRPDYTGTITASTPNQDGNFGGPGGGGGGGGK